MEKQPKIPTVQPAQFDEYLFENWKAPVTLHYEKFHISRVEDYKSYLKLPTSPHRRSVFFLIFLTKGQVVRLKGLTKYRLTENTCFCLSADQITGIDYVSADAEGYYVHFKPEIFYHPNLKVDFFKDFPMFSHVYEPLFQVEDIRGMLALFELLLQEHLNENLEVLPLVLAALLIKAQTQNLAHKSLKPDASTLLTHRYKNALAEFVCQKKTVAEYAAYLSVSPNHLLKCVKNTTGKTAHALLDEMRLLEAKVLLKQSNKSISEVAEALGEKEASDFSRFFRLKTGQSPSQYRKN